MAVIPMDVAVKTITSRSIGKNTCVLSGKRPHKKRLDLALENKALFGRLIVAAVESMSHSVDSYCVA